MDSATIKEAAQEIAKILDESNKNAIRQIERLIEHIGKDFVEAHIKETQRIQAEGGLMTNDKERKRTMGGVFFFIVKPKLTPEQRALVFLPTDWKKIKAEKKLRAAQQRKTEPKPDQAAPKVPQVQATDPLSQLQAAADTLRERIAEMEAKGQKGVAMTEKLLQNTERQIEALTKQAAD